MLAVRWRRLLTISLQLGSLEATRAEYTRILREWRPAEDIGSIETV